MVKITTQTDFASKEDMVYDLARSVAKAAYGYGFTSWQEFADSNNDDYIKSITDRMDGIRNELKEKVEITDIVILRV
jgi:translation elongation factor EF-Ts